MYLARSRFLLVSLLATLGCTHGNVVAPEARPKADAQLTLVQLDPPAGTALTESSVIHVIVDYRVLHMDPAAHYGIMPIFGDRSGGGHGFITSATLEEVGELRTADGRADLRFAVKNAWRDERFGHPPSISFHLVMQYPESGIDAIAEIGPFSYK